MMRPHAPHPIHPFARPGRIRSGPVFALLAAGLIAVSPATAQKSGGGGGQRPPAPTRPPRTSTAPLPRGQAMNETTLAVVGDRRITIAPFRTAWKGLKPPARPDSLTPKSAREFLELLIDKESLGARAMRENLPWSRRDSATFASYVDQVTLRARLAPMLDSMAAVHRAAGDTVRTEQALGVLVRDSTSAALHTRFDALLASRLAMRWAAIPRPSADSSVAAQLRVMGALPQIEASDLNKTLAWSDAGNLKVSELLDHWKLTDPIHRPRVENAAQVEDLGRNVLFERWLRKTTAEMKIAERPDLAAQIALRREYLAVNGLVYREVDQKLPSDTTTWRRWYDQHRSDYDLPGSAQLLTLFLPDRASAGSMFKTLLVPAKAESLIAQGQRGGVSYIETVSDEGDSIQYHRALRAGAGAVLGPDSTANGWRVARVQSFSLARPRTFEEALMFVQHDIQQTEGEKLMRRLIERTRAQTKIAVNEPAVRRLGERGF